MSTVHFWPGSQGKRASDVRLPTIRPTRDHALEQAIAANAFSIRFQPQIDPASGRVVGVEALARWDEEENSTLLFARAAASGLGERLSRAVQKKALGIAGRWAGARRQLRLSINLIADDLMREGYVGWLLEEIVAAGLSAERVTVEITESSLIVDQPAAAARLASLRAAGVQIAIDDFGTGYCSLAYLTTLPLDALKIDRAMIADLVGGERDRIVVRAMIRLARELDLKVIVEGVESTQQLALVAEWGCDAYQGFLGAGALDEEELERFVRASMLEAA
ncbi:MAG: EAL domain-containing protein [Pseudomonadota bacterium]|jgi:EAL domain-containing protein (putative c-di-GMP-specific phosphodiesterase class I)|nr:EAL domain-containing protein [Pseudomonadota bacterium]